MATSRIIRRGFVDSDRVNRLDWFSECLYHRLLLVADDYGLFDARIPYLKTQLFGMKPNPVRDADLQRALASVESAGLVRTYAVDGKPYVQILDYGQKVRSKPKYPPPPDCGQLQTIADNCEQLQTIADNCGQCAADCGRLRQNVSLYGDVYGDVDGVGDVVGDGDVDGEKRCIDREGSIEEAGRERMRDAMTPRDTFPDFSNAPRPSGEGEVDAFLAGQHVLKLTPAERQKCAMAFYNEAEAIGWIDKDGNNIWNWKAAAMRYAMKWAENLHTPFRNGRKEDRPSRNTGTANEGRGHVYDIR